MDYYVLLATLSWGFWGFCQKNAAMRMNTIDIQFISFVSGFIMMIGYFWVHRQSMNVAELDMKGSFWAAAAHAFTLIASFAYLKAIINLDATTVTLAVSIYPVVTFLLAVLFLGERVTIGKMVGIPIVFLGIWISGRT